MAIEGSAMGRALLGKDLVAMHKKDIPSFGTLSDVKVVCSAVSTAGPFAADLYADNGADVIMLESPHGMDVYRWSNDGWGIEAERRNMRSLCLDLSQDEGKELFLKLIRDADVFIEASRGGQWDRRGLGDEVLWGVNEKLVICHMSGYGQTGEASYVARPGYDMTVQAYSGLLELNGTPEGGPNLGSLFPTDYYAGLMAFGATLAAYIKMLKTGKGDSIDLAQYEVAMRCQGPTITQYLNSGYQWPRQGRRQSTQAGVGIFECADGRSVYALPIGEGPTKATCKFLGLDYGGEIFPEGMPMVLRGTPAEKPFESALEEYFAAHTACEAEKALLSVGVPVCRIMDYAELSEDPHCAARGTFIEYENVEGELVKACAPIPRFKNNPGMVWRGAPSVGFDGEDILDDLGVAEGEASDLVERGVVSKKPILRIRGM